MSEPTVTRAPEPDGPTVAGDGTGEPVDGAPIPPPGYELHSLIGSGGMGTVYRAHDQALARDVALKFLHARYTPDSITAWRFTEEARITARLQHPGIPPIHQVGQTPDGRPFLAMKLIKGETLDELLKARKSPAEDRGRVVGIFEQVAQAVGFAHSRHIIHRDLKPANVMVGGFGEVQVMDWGLAKELGEAPTAETQQREETLSVELRLHREDGDVTQAGSLLGTPAYMPPEQAVGAIDQITERSDVFGLGAILCVILTGEPPFVAENAESTRVIAARGKLDDCFTRLDRCGAEPELVALCKRCLSPEAADRPKDGGEVADAVAAFRADAERRARQAEMEKAKAEVKAAEERKRRRVQRILALTVLGLLVVIGYTARRIDNEVDRQRREQEAKERQIETEQQKREADLRARQLVTERDVTAALNEVQVLREQGLKQVDDPERWMLTLVAARSAFLRAEGLLAAGAPTDAVVRRLAVAASDLDRDERDRRLLAELDRIAEENDVRFLIPVTLSRKPSERYAAAFRAHGIDLVEAPLAEAAAWLKGHRFRQRLAGAVRNWQSSLPWADLELVFKPAPLFEAAPALAAVGGTMASAAYPHRPTLRNRLRAVADAATDNAFTREWWDAVGRRDAAALKRLLTRPELDRISSAELSSLADGLFGDFGPWNNELLNELLRRAYERFPGDFWVNFRLAGVAAGRRVGEDQAAGRARTIRHLNAAVAARPRSAIARVALASELLEQNKGDPAPYRMIRDAADLDPTSAWPHLFLAFIAVEGGKWTEVGSALQAAVRADADTAFFMAATLPPWGMDWGGSPVSDEELARIIESLIAARPDHPGGYDLRAGFRYERHDYRGALEDRRAAKARAKPDQFPNPTGQMQLDALEKIARWQEKLPAVLRGELKPMANEYGELAYYCAGFERKFALAARFGGEALAADPTAPYDATKVTNFTGWAVRASQGRGADAADLPADQRAGLRRQALAWLREARKQEEGRQFPALAYQLWRSADLAPVREPEELAKLPPDERIAWEKFWKELPNPFVRRIEVAPPPREVKR